MRGLLLRRSGQTLVEFALVLPLLGLFLFGIVDLGRSIYYYSGVSQAVGEAARTAALGTNGLPANADVLAAAQASSSWIQMGPCPNGPTAEPPAGVAWLYVTAPATANSDGGNAPGGETDTAPTPGCDAATPALASGDRLQVTVMYTFAPFTPLISQIVGNQIVLTSSSVVPVEY